MLTLLDLRGRDLASDDGWAVLAETLTAPVVDEEPLAVVREVLAAVRERGDRAVREFTARFDGCDIDNLRVPSAEIEDAFAAADPSFREALEFARNQIADYHRTQLHDDVRHERSGIVVRERAVPVDRAGLYVPGGRAAYPSTVLMTAVPARVAGVPEIALCVPPDVNGTIPAPTLAAAALVGVDEIYRIGGAQAIAALAYGTESVRSVDVVVGPGNIYVTLAKREVSGTVGVESLAGPSELVVVADGASDPEWVAIDLIAQAEHGPGGKAVLVTWNEELVERVDTRLAELTAAAARRGDIETTMQAGGYAVLVDDPDDAMVVSNWIAPEHLQLMNADPEMLVPQVRNAGAVFCGPFAPAPVGDYVAGVNHVLPTARTARFSSALRVQDFQKYIHVVALDQEALTRVAPYISTLADVEGLEAHGRSVQLRGRVAAPADRSRPTDGSPRSP